MKNNTENRASYIPTLTSLFITALRATVREDINRDSSSTLELFLENSTFHERVLCNFVIIASGFYTKEEIVEWFDNTFFSEDKKLKDSMWE